jgi:hypothetical protein
MEIYIVPTGRKEQELYINRSQQNTLCSVDSGSGNKPHNKYTQLPVTVNLLSGTQLNLTQGLYTIVAHTR